MQCYMGPLMLMGGPLLPLPAPRSLSLRTLHLTPACLTVFAAQLLWTVRLHLWRADFILVWRLSVYVVLCSSLPFGVLLALALWNGRQGLTRMPSLFNGLDFIFTANFVSILGRTYAVPCSHSELCVWLRFFWICVVFDVHGDFIVLIPCLLLLVKRFEP